MKKLFLIISTIVALSLNAQQLSTSGQSNLKFYNKAIERLQKMKPGSMGYDEAIMDAEKKIASIKKTDPAYDVSSLEQEIGKYKQSNKQKEEENNDVGKLRDLDKELNSFLTWNIDEYKNSNTQAEFDLLDKKIDERISLLADFCKNKLSTGGAVYLNKIEDHWNVNGPDETCINSTKNHYANAEERTVFSYYKIKWLFNKWKLFSEAYPLSTDIAEAAKKANDVLKMIGSAEEAQKHAEKVRTKRIADVKMEASVVDDPNLEAQIKKAVLGTKFANGKTIVKINIHSKEWTVQKHSISGATLSRTKGFSAGLKGSDGKCYLLHYVDYKQDYVGGTFGQGYINLGEEIEILCENVK